ncbi:hypothetical protein [Pleionea sediminis]|uniref:hypothetical protein n=1 Tax=Pleionea sediminis TaxID=2569479 RepID=UPI001184B82A|nr:hypothetical protein [Pleionea sediminis]
MNTEAIMESLFESRAPNLPADGLAEVFDRLIWCLADNGAEICKVKEKWLESDSFDRCSIALHMNETFPYETIEEMKSSFDKIVSKWPQFSDKCDEILKRRAEQNV